MASGSVYRPFSAGWCVPPKLAPLGTGRRGVLDSLDKPGLQRIVIATDVIDPSAGDRIHALLKADEATHIDEIVERLEPELSSSEIFAALFELELAGKVKQMPGKNFVRSF